MLSISRLTAGKPAWRELPFYSLLDFEVSSMYNKWDLLENDTFVKYLADNNKNNEICQFHFHYFTETEFNQRYCNSDCL